MARIFFISWGINALTLYILARLFSHGISIANLVPAGGGMITTQGLISILVGGLVIGFLNSIIKPVLQILSLPLTCLTLGLFSFVVTGLVFYLASIFTPGMHLASFWWAIAGGVLFGLINSFIHWLFGADREAGTQE